MTAETPGEEARRRREALGFSVRKLADRFDNMEVEGVGRATIAKIEQDDPSVEPLTRKRLFAALARLEKLMGVDDPGQIVNVIELPDGTRATFTGSAEGVAEAAARFLREREGS